MMASPSIRNELAFVERGLDDGREAVGPVIAVAAEAADAQAIPAHHQPVAVMLDFVNPERVGGRPVCLGELAGFDETGGAAQDHGRRIEQWPRGSTAPIA